SEAIMIPNRILFRSLEKIFHEILPSLGLEYHPLSAEKLIFIFGNKLGLPLDLQTKAVDIFKKLYKKGCFNGKDPKGLAAALLYFVAKETSLKLTQSEVANAGRVTEVTIRSRLKDITCNI
ncbi:MAG: hypothetical protein ACFFG0_15445, partial [Candidatus Thorarchaeota archaeon]